MPPRKSHSRKQRQPRGPPPQNSTQKPVTIVREMRLVPPRIQSWIRADISGFIPTVTNTNPNWCDVVIDPWRPYNALTYNANLYNFNGASFATMHSGYTINVPATLWATYGGQVYQNYRVLGSRISVSFDVQAPSDDIVVAVGPGPVFGLSASPPFASTWNSLFGMQGERFVVDKLVKYISNGYVVNNAVNTTDLFGVSKSQFEDDSVYTGVTYAGGAGTPVAPNKFGVWRILFQQNNSNSGTFAFPLGVKVVMNLNVEWFSPTTSL